MTQTSPQELVNALFAPALVCTDAGVIRELNESAAEWLGMSRNAVVGQIVEELLCASDEGLTDFLQRSFHDGHSSYKGQLRNARMGSGQSTMLCHAQRLLGQRDPKQLLLIFTSAEFVEVPNEYKPDYSHHSDPSSWKGSSLDSVQRRPNAGDVTGMNVLNDVTIGLVHEVSQPLTAVSTYAHSCHRWLSAGKTDHPKLLPTMEKIIEQVHVTGQMINSLKGLVRSHHDERQACDLNQLVRESLDVLALDPRAERCAVETHLAASPCPVVVSSAQIKIVLLNLLRNALDASLALENTNSSLYVAVKAEEKSWATATVTDSGEGITEPASEHLFQPFVSTKPNGLGLGLAISRCLATAHDGYIEYQPVARYGASFQLRLPMAHGC